MSNGSARGDRPLLFQVNTRIFLQERGRDLRRRATLDDVPDALFDDLAAKGFSWIWFLGGLDHRPRRASRLAVASGLAGGLRTGPPGPDRRGHHRLSLRHPGLRRLLGVRGRSGAGAPTRPGRPARAPAPPRLRPQPRLSRSSVGEVASGVLHRGDRGRPHPGARQLGPPARRRRARAGAGAGSVLPGLAGHRAAQLPPRRPARGDGG